MPNIMAVPTIGRVGHTSTGGLLPTWALTTASQPHSCQLQPEPSSHSGPELLGEGTAGAERERRAETEAAWSRARTPGAGPIVKLDPPPDLMEPFCCAFHSVVALNRLPQLTTLGPRCL